VERDELMAEIHELTARIRAHHTGVREASARRRELILAAVATGASDAEIATAAGISRQAVERIRNARPRKPGR